MNDLGKLLSTYVRSVVTVLVVVVLAAVWWFGWMSPKGAAVASARTQATTDQTDVISLDNQINQLIVESAKVRRELPFLKRFPQAIPPEPEYGQLAVEIQQLEQKTGVLVTSLTIPPASVPTTPGGVGTISLGISVTGGHDDLLKFIAGLTGTGPDPIARLVTLRNFGLGGTGGSVLSSSQASFTAGLSATAYTTYDPAPPAAPVS